MKKTLGKKFWASMLIFGLVGQVAWVVENMYLNVFIYKMFHAAASEISLMVSASSVAAALTTILVGALSDKIGKRKILICLGYIVWGISIIGFAFLRVELLTPIAGGVMEAAALGVSLTIILDCIMTFFGSSANDAAYNAWLTDSGDESNRGKIEGFNSMMPLVSILVVFGGFMGFNLDLADSWITIFGIIGGVVLVIGVLGFFLIEEQAVKKQETSYWSNVIYSFRPSVLKDHKLLYCVIGCFALFGISIQAYMPYLIIYYEKSLAMSNYVLVLAPAIILAAVVTALYGKIYDMSGFKTAIILPLVMLMGGYVVLYFTRSAVPVFIGSLLMMCGYMTGMSVFGAMIRERIPQGRAGEFQGIRIIGQVLIPGIIGPAIGAWVLQDAEQILNNDGTYSFLPNENIWAAAFLCGVVLILGLMAMFHMMRVGHYDLWSEAGIAVRDGRVSPWEEYPRPQMKRDGYLLLNGTWKLNGADIRIPFPPQAKLSGYQKKAGSELHYEKEFTLPASFMKDKILLHFGAVDQIAEVYINGEFVGRHEGGYLPFTCDITSAVDRDGNNILEVKAIDTLSRVYPYGKQTKKRGGMWYTPVSGIWQSVWLENVPFEYIERVVLKPDLQGVDITLEGQVQGFDVMVPLPDGGMIQTHFEGKRGRIHVKDGIFWTPDHPHLYQMTISTDIDSAKSDSSKVDTIETYFALRTIGIKEIDGVNRVCLNGEPIFLHGLLDQGYYCDGLYLAADEEEYKRDILRMKELGYNLLRKHIKVEPECFYYYCDKYGMLIMQDMVNNGSYDFIRDTALPTFGMKKRSDTGKGMNGRTQQIFLKHSKETIEHLFNHPCIIAYTVFNEGWGQFCSDEVYDLVKSWDDTRLVDSASGWFAQEKNDFDSEHIYFKVVPLSPGMRPMFVSECGGYTMAAEGHYYSRYNTYGYGTCHSKKELTDQIEAMYRGMIFPYIRDGVCGCIYTQVSDVEDEINGLYTYDRAVCKVEKERMYRLSEELKGVLR